MRKAKLHEIITCVLFCGFIGIMGILYLALPKESFSQLEKRELASSPILTMDTLVSGQFGADLESYMADHMPGRDFFVGLGAYYDLATCQQSSKDIYLAHGGCLVETPADWDPAQAEKNMRYINAFAETLGQKVDLILVPSAGFFLEDSIRGIHDSYCDDEMIRAIYEMADGGVNTMDLVQVFQYRDGLYYRTDHHWTSQGAFLAYRAYMDHLGREAVSQNFFSVETFEGFRGSTYSRSALWLTAAEPIELWHGSHLTVENSTTGAHDGVFYYDRLQQADMYTVYLDGNQPLVRIYNEGNAGKGKLLVIRDSYANCIGPFLAESYEEVVMIDLRYYRQAASALVEAEGFDNVLILYSIGNFMTDANFPFLQ